MALRLVEESSLTAIANEIRQKAGTIATLEFPDGFVDAIDSISGGGDTFESIVLNQTQSVYESLNVTSVPAYALFRSALLSLSLPNAISVGQYSFARAALTEVRLPLLASIPAYAFQYNKLQSAVFSAVTSIGNYAFQGESTSAMSGNANLELSFPEATSIGQNAFNLCRLKSLSIPKVATIGTSAFLLGIMSGGTVTLPTTLTGLGGGSAFKNFACAGFVFEGQAPTIPVSTFEVNSLASGSKPLLYDFSNCTAVPTLSNTNAFGSIHGSAKIVVPDDLYDSWIAANNWSNSTIKSKIIKKSDYVGS